MEEERERKKEKKKETNLLDLPQDCIAHILSLTSPICAVRSSIVCKAFYSAIQSDIVWDKFLPLDYQEFVNSSSAANELHTKKDAVLRLCSSHVMSVQEPLSFSMDKWTGKKSYMIGPKGLRIKFGDEPHLWRWKSHPDSRFGEVAELLHANDIFLTGAFYTRILSPDTTYRMYFSYMLGPRSRGFDACPLTVVVHGKDTLGAYLGGPKYNRIKCFYLKGPNRNNLLKKFRQPEDAFELRRDSDDHGWGKIYLGKYHNQVGVPGAAELLIMTVAHPPREGEPLMSGLIIHGIEMVPVN